MEISKYHMRQYEQCYESTSGLLEFMDECAGTIGQRRVLDVACGGGANIYHMLNRWSYCQITGVDMNRNLLDYARMKMPSEFALRCSFEELNLFDLPKRYAAKAFDITTLIQTLGPGQFGPDEYPGVLQALVHVTKQWIFLSALFTDAQMDVSHQIRLYVPSEDYPSGQVAYHTFCMSRFRRVCEDLCIKEVLFRNFEISIDLTVPSHGGLGTYTVKMADGRRLQFSGTVFMPWKFVALRLK